MGKNPFVERPLEGAGYGRKKILVVDDDKDVRESVRAVLESQSFRVLEDASGEGLLRRVFQEDVDLVLLDIMMPGMDGVTACKALKKNVKLDREVPVIMLTRKKDRESVVRAVHAGADDYIVKPFEPAVLLEKIRKHLP